MTTFNIQKYLDSLPEDIRQLELSSKGLTYLPSLKRFKFLQKLICSDNQLTSLPPLPSSLQELYCENNLLPFCHIDSWRTFDKFRTIYYQKKFGPKLERYFLNIMKKRKRDIHNEILYSPRLGFYKQFVDPKTLDIMKQ